MKIQNSEFRIQYKRFPEFRILNSEFLKVDVFKFTVIFEADFFVEILGG